MKGMLDFDLKSTATNINVIPNAFWFAFPWCKLLAIGIGLMYPFVRGLFALTLYLLLIVAQQITQTLVA